MATSFTLYEDTSTTPESAGFMLSNLRATNSLGSIQVPLTVSVRDLMNHVINWLRTTGKIQDQADLKTGFQFYLWHKAAEPVTYPIFSPTILPPLPGQQVGPSSSLLPPNLVEDLQASEITYVYPDDFNDARLETLTLQNLISTRDERPALDRMGVIFAAMRPERMYDRLRRAMNRVIVPGPRPPAPFHLQPPFPITPPPPPSTFNLNLPSVMGPVMPTGSAPTAFDLPMVGSALPSSFGPGKFNILPPATTPASFLNPPSFAVARPDNLRCEGYWDEAYHPANFINQDRWSGKEEWLRRAYAVNNYLKQNRMFNQYRGFAHSRLVAGQNVGSGEYYDQAYNMCWPEGYVGHYIDDNDVMPTQRFYEYILMRYEALPPSFK